MKKNTVWLAVAAVLAFMFLKPKGAAAASGGSSAAAGPTYAALGIPQPVYRAGTSEATVYSGPAAAVFIEAARSAEMAKIGIVDSQLDQYRAFVTKVLYSLGGSYKTTTFTDGHSETLMTKPASWAGDITSFDFYVQAEATKRWQAGER